MPGNWKHKHGTNDWYEELCALAAIGEVSHDDYEDLQRHLAECPECRELYADFQRISAEDLGTLAVQKKAEAFDGEPIDPGNEDEQLARFFKRVNHVGGEPAAASPSLAGMRFTEERNRVGACRWPFWTCPALLYGAVLLLIGAASGALTYHFHDIEHSPAVLRLTAELNATRDRSDQSAAREQSALRSLEESRADREALEKAITEERTRYVALFERQNRLESELATAQTQLERSNQDLQAAKAGTEESGRIAADLRTRLQNAIRRTMEEERISEGLKMRLQSLEQASTGQPTPGQIAMLDPADARNLFGARDLHIVDVYDVDGTGKTKRTYGRVFYVEKKLLTFYAFDLQDKQRKRTVAGFQAWGYRQANSGKAENLGLFHIDSASLNRWVLTVNDPGILDRIDAVFVTLEPPGGSPSPRGRKVLYANLSSPPNHP